MMLNLANNQTSGLLLLDKPKGYSSNAALQAVRRLFNKIKAGHTGCLDPLATGMLPICLGEATKFSQYILEKDKTYIAEGRLGITTTTGDIEGEILEERDASNCTLAMLHDVLPQFLGEIMQVPPMFSAIKVQGTPLYKLARKGQTLERSARSVSIEELKLQQFNPPYFRIFVRCSKGTYIRSLVEDIGSALGVGAHVSDLRRLSTAGFEEDNMVSLEELEECSERERQALVLPTMRAVENMPSLEVTDEQQLMLFHGKQVMIGIEEEQLCSLVNMTGEFLGVGKCIHGVLSVKRLVKATLTPTPGGVGEHPNRGQ